ncbi:Transcription factor TT8 [Capsicum chinense]|nr:Transcription factor TT8 [Capsicum chinense]
MNNLFPNDFSNQTPPPPPPTTTTTRKAIILPIDQNLHSSSSSSSEYSPLYLNEIQKLTQFPKIEGEDDALRQAYLAVLSSSSSPSPSLSRGQTTDKLTRMSSAFTKFRPDNYVSTSCKHHNNNILKRYMTFFNNLYMINRQEGVRATTTQVHHMISERRRREKLNENFQHLRSLLPLGTKKDKASVLASTTDYISCLKDQVKELCKRNEILEAQLLNKKEAFQFQQNESGKVAVYITNVEERIVDLQVIARGKCSIVDLVICLMKFLKMVNFVNLVAIDANTTLVQSCPVAVITLRLTIQGDEWEESTFIEATKRVVEYTT